MWSSPARTPRQEGPGIALYSTDYLVTKSSVLVVEGAVRQLVDVVEALTAVKRSHNHIGLTRINVDAA